MNFLNILINFKFKSKIKFKIKKKLLYQHFYLKEDKASLTIIIFKYLVQIFNLYIFLIYIYKKLFKNPFLFI